MRKFWRALHLWMGLTAGTLLVVIGLTGSALVFYRYLEEQIYADTLLIEAPETHISIDEALKAAVNAYPEETVLGVMAPRHEEATYLAYRYYTPESANEPIFTYVSVHPTTGKVLGERQWGKTVMTFLYSLHYTLTLGPIGSIVVGFIGIVFMLSLFTGLYLWWPKSGKWKQALWFKKNAGTHRRNFDIHRVFGFYPLIVLLVIAFSGTYMIFPQQVRSVVELTSPLFPDLEHEANVQAPEGATPLRYHTAIAIGRRIFPDAAISRFDRPHDPRHPYVIRFHAKGQPGITSDYNEVFVEPYTGEILGIKRWDKASGGDKFLAWQFPLHNGEAFGLPGRLLVFASGFLPLVLYITGLNMWLKRRRGRKNVARENISLILTC